MKSKVFKIVMLVCLTTEMSSVWAGQPVFEDWFLRSAIIQSKNPSHWERRQCSSGTRCAVVESVFQDEDGNIKCKTSNDLKISCTELVEKYGTNIKGFSIEVDLPFNPEVTANNIVYCIPDFEKASSSQFCH